MVGKKSVNVALIGQGFMGRTHSNAWGQVRKFFKAPIEPVMHTVFGEPEENPQAFAANWGWARASTNWRKLVRSPEIDVVDIVTPNFMHAPVAKAALAAGKAVCSEKPLAGKLKDARDMVAAARKARVRTFVCYNYRRCPAVGLAHLLVKRGKLGQIRHVRALYLQDWADESVPLAWRFDRKKAGSGAHGDLNAHIVDMTRFVTGQEITEICGAISETFIKERSLMTGTVAGGIAAGLRKGRRKGRVTVDDTVLFLARFSGGAVASFEAARQATGNQNRNTFEITRESHLSRRGDCIIAVASNKGVGDLSDEFKRLLRQGDARLTIRIEAGSIEDVVTSRGDPRLILTHCTDSVVRKSNYVCSRTLAVKADKAAVDLSRQLVKKLKSPQQRVDIALTIETPM